ncbi:MAG: Adenine permease AdeP [Chlamydiae bacterium]|nr:Adenine permease AdeP [Chlamydiota bacterium]
MSLLNRFHLKENQSSLKNELLAGLTSFSTLSYAILLIPLILSDAGMDFGAVMSATLITAGVATLLMGLLANYPFVLAPGLALTVYFTYVVVLAKGHSWQTALGVVFIGGVLFLILNILGIRQLIIQTIPSAIRIGTTAGLGLFLALIGLKNAGIIVSHPKTFLTYGDPTAPSTILAIIGLIVISVLMIFRIRGALFLGIVFLWLLGFLFGISEFKGFVSLPASIAPTFFQFDLRAVFDLHFLDVVIAFIFVALFDTSAVLIGLAEEGNFLKKCPGDEKRCIYPRISEALLPDSLGSILASFLGTTTLSIYMESATGISVGGRTGLTSVVVALCFFLALFFTPFVTSIPLFASAPALVIVGGMMVRGLGKLNWTAPSEWIPAFVTLILIPLTGDIAVGIGVGFILLPLIKLFTGKAREVHFVTWILALLFLLKFALLPLF